MSLQEIETLQKENELLRWYIGQIGGDVDISLCSIMVAKSKPLLASDDINSIEQACALISTLISSPEDLRGILSVSGQDMSELCSDVFETDSMYSLFKEAGFHHAGYVTLALLSILSRFPEYPLESIQINDANVFALPDRLSGVQTIQYLDLSNNHFQIIPKQILQLSGLCSLELSHNCIGFIPTEIQLLQNLETLDLSHNDIDSIPIEITDIKTLKKLIIRDNGIHYDEISHDFISSFANLEVLDITKVESFADEFSHIDFSKFQMTEEKTSGMEDFDGDYFVNWECITQIFSVVVGHVQIFAYEKKFYSGDVCWWNLVGEADHIQKIPMERNWDTFLKGAYPHMRVKW